MKNSQNRRETGATKYPANTDPDPSDEFSQDAASNDRPHVDPSRNRKQGEVEDKTHQSDGRNPPRQPTPSPATERPGAVVSPALMRRNERRRRRREA
ncbi:MULTISPECIES: hypothetical protein [unclassified Mesorhizobium]|uniref:hypothetical protein n=1 Tax=unclassified Mesorhizobium TaxID=325217 RepID=UPI0015E32C7A|nr:MULTISPECIES: hypothetical protein [unclassified Mesorhizobium]